MVIHNFFNMNTLLLIPSSSVHNTFFSIEHLLLLLEPTKFFLENARNNIYHQKFLKTNQLCQNVSFHSGSQQFHATNHIFDSDIITSILSNRPKNLFAALNISVGTKHVLAMVMYDLYNQRIN